MITKHNVFPTCVGMNRAGLEGFIEIVCVPHMRGDEPITGYFHFVLLRCSPHAWG